MKKLLFISFLIIALLLTITSNLFVAASGGNDEEDNRSIDRVLVSYQPGTSDLDRDIAASRHGGRVVETIPGINVQVVEIPRGTAKEKSGEFSGEARVRYAEPDYLAYAQLTPNDPYLSNQWGITKIQAPQAWDITTGLTGVKVAILDTGIDQNHEDLLGKIALNRNFTNSRTVDDIYGHGTHVAGITAASTNNGKGVAGTGYNTRLMNGKVLGDNGSGNYSWIANGIIWATDNGAKVISMSLGGSSGSSTMESAVNYAWSKGVVVVAAAGNSNTTAPSYPGYYTNAIAVAATDQNDVRAYFSNYGDWVDIAAPGVSIYSTLPNHSNRIGIRNYGSLSGTSMATPFVSGVAALVAAVHPTWTNAEIRAKLQSSTDATTGFTTTIGRINALEAVSP